MEAQSAKGPQRRTSPKLGGSEGRFPEQLRVAGRTKEGRSAVGTAGQCPWVQRTVLRNVQKRSARAGS